MAQTASRTPNEHRASARPAYVRHILSKGDSPMLVLSRKKGESIVVNNDITITVVEIRGDKVRLGIVAPKELPVHRQEVYDAIHGKLPDQPPQRAIP